MIARTTAGRSFKGVALYVLHDKERAKTSDRVAFIETVNLPTDDPSRAVAHMVDTATHADQLKTANGMTAGRKLEKPVYHYTLAWHPTEAPTQAEQVEAARESMKALGLSDRQALIVAHTDTAHPHVHVIVNRVCPETGKAANISNDRLKLSQWAQDYEQRRGRVFCDAREANNAERDKGQWVKDDSPTRQQWTEWKKGQSKELWDQYRVDKEQAQPARKAQYEALWRQKENRFSFRSDEIKALYKPIWRDVFKRQKASLRDFDAGILPRIKFALSQKDRNALIGVMQALIDKADLRRAFVREQEVERKSIAARQRQTINDASREVTKAWKYDREQLKESHRQQDDTLHQTVKGQVNQLWQERPPQAPTPTQDRGAESLRAFDKTADRRRPENRVERSSLDNLPNEDTAEQAKTQARKENRIERQKRERSRPRARGRGRTLDDL
jgi:hypothetical protein